MYRILICDDEEDIRSALRIYLHESGYETAEASNGAEVLELLKQQSFDLVLMDIMMPVMDGLTAIKEIRKSVSVPVILLTAKSEDSDKITGLDVGADDYITKPFNSMEVLARLRAVLRRYAPNEHKEDLSRICVGGIVMDDSAKTVMCDGEPVNVTPKEYDILKLFLENPGKVFSSQEIYSLVWKEIPLGMEGTIPVHIRHLREKIEINPAEPRYLKVVWGKGYKLEKQS